MSVYSILRDAIVNKKHVFCDYQRHGRGVCPHVLGTKNGKEHVLVYQFSGFTSKGLVDPKGEWKCFDVNQISNITSCEVSPSEWRTGTSHKKPQTCVDEIDVEVDY